MKLDLNFDALTKLKDWWKQVKANFEKIETECTETREIADNACTKERAKAYVAEFAGASPEYVEAINAFRTLFEQSGESMDALEKLSGKRVKYKVCETLDIETITENGVYICIGTSVNTPNGTGGVLIDFSRESDGCMLWITDAGEKIYRRLNDGAWYERDTEINIGISELKGRMEDAETQKCEVVFGTYTGDGTEERLIDLGFEPVAVEVYDSGGYQGDYDNFSYTIRGGLALKDVPCFIECDGVIVNAVSIAQNGFTVCNKVLNGKGAGASDYYAYTNTSNKKYYFKAYKNGEILVK